MGKVCESYLDFMAPLETTSTALNGLLKVDGPLTAVRETYSLDIKRETKNARKKKNEELKALYSQVLVNAKNIQFRLVRVNDEVTRLYYRIEKRKIAAYLDSAIGFQILLSVFFAWLVHSIVRSSERLALIVCGLVFVLCMILFSFLPIMISRLNSDEKIMQSMNGYFVQRVNTYIAIARKYQANNYY